MSALIAYRWDGDGMVPMPRFKRECDRDFVIGAVYLMEAQEERSAQSHRHYFACVREAWLNLPEALSPEFPTEDVLRKHALIRTGFCDAQSIVLASKAEANRVADFIRKAPGEYAITTVNGTTVTRLTAQSQSMRAMGKERFQQSKDAVLDFLATSLGINPASLSQRAAAA